MDIINLQGLPFIACLVMLSVLCYIGIHVLKREVIFIDIALAQIAAVGAIAAHVVFHLHGHSMYANVLAFGSTLAAAAFFAVVRRRIVEIPLEAVIGVSYAVSAAAALFLVGVAPGGHVHIQEMLSGSILWATWNDVLWSAGVIAPVGACFFLFRKPFRAISDNYEGALAEGYNTLAWDFFFYALVGIVITTAVRIAGVVVVFTFLIIPATLSAVFSTGWTGRLLVAWTAGAVSAALGLLFADRYDFSVGPAIALYLGAMLVVVGLLRRARLGRAATAAACLVIAAALGVWFAAGSAAGDSFYEDETAMALQETPPAQSGEHRHDAFAGHGHAHDIHADHGYAGEVEEKDGGIDEESLREITGIEQLETFFNRASDAEESSMVIGRALDVDVRAGAKMAIEFLRDDPPLLFRIAVIDKLEEVTGREVPYDIEQPFSAQSNREAVEGLRKALGLE